MGQKSVEVVKIAPCMCELSDPKIKKSPTYSDFENFYPHPQLDIKFLNP